MRILTGVSRRQWQRLASILGSAAAFAFFATTSQAAVHAQLSWTANAASPQTDLAAPGAENTLFVTLTGVPSSGFKGAEIDLKWAPGGNALDCLTQTGVQFRTSAGTTCTYLNRGSAVPVTTIDVPGHLHVAWADPIANTDCTDGTIAQVSFQLDGCVSPIAVFELCSVSYLDQNNIAHALLAGDLGSPATILGGGGYGSPCNPGPNPQDLQWWSGFDAQGVNGGVRALHLDNGALYAAGFFTQVGDRTASRVARFNGSTWDSLSSGIHNAAGQEVGSALASYAGGIVLGGRFDHAGGAAIPWAASWNGATWSGLGDGFNGLVNALLPFNEALVAGGNFSTNTDITNDLHAVAEYSGSAWSQLGEGMTLGSTLGRVNALAVHAGDLYDGGLFSNSGAIAVSNVAHWTGGAWQPLGLGTDGEVFALASFQGRLVAGGLFTSAGGLATPHIAMWDGVAWAPVGNGFDGPVYALGVFGNTLVATGAFQFSGATEVHNIARWDGTSWQPLGSGLDQAGRALASDGVYLYVGGDFTHAGGKPSRYIARWYDDAPTKAIIPPAPDGTGDPRVSLAVTGSASRAAQVRFSVTLPEPSRVELRVFDVSGRLAMPTTVSALPAGAHTLGLGSSAPLASGVYTVQLSAGRTTRSHRFVVLR